MHMRNSHKYGNSKVNEVKLGTYVIWDKEERGGGV